MITKYNKITTKLDFRTVLLSVSVVAMAVPQLAGAQVPASNAAEEARSAELMCELGGVCGDVADNENARVKQVQGGKSTRAMMSIGSVKAAIPSRQSTETIESSTRNVVREPVRLPSDDVNLQAATTVKSAPRYVSVETQEVPDFRSQLNVNFALGSAQLTDDSMFDIRSFVLAVKNLDELGARKSFRIEGHADSSGSESVNVPLSAERAKAVRDLIVNSGIEDGRIEYAGYGSSVPLPSVPPDSYLNRRVEAVLIE